jgi:hypothetical protein
VNDLEKDLRELLKARADRVPAQRSVPRGMLRRARRRVAVAALSGTMVAAALAVGSVAGMRAFSGSNVQAGHTPTPSVAQPPNPDASASAPQLTASTCHARNLTVAFSAPEPQSSFGSIVVTNSGKACRLAGTPAVELLDSRGNTYPTSEQGVDPWWRYNGQPEPAGGELVRLARGGSAQVRVSVSNWCIRGFATWRVTLPDDGALEIADLPPSIYGICTDPASGATVLVGPVEPAS